MSYMGFFLLVCRAINQNVAEFAWYHKKYFHKNMTNVLN